MYNHTVMANEFDLVEGTVFEANLRIWSKDRDTPRAHIKGVVVEETGEVRRASRIFYFTVLESDATEDFEIGKRYGKRGYTLYPSLTSTTQPAGYTGTPIPANQWGRTKAEKRAGKKFAARRRHGKKNKNSSAVHSYKQPSFHSLGYRTLADID